MAWYDFVQDAWGGIKGAVETVYDSALKPVYNSVIKPVYENVLKPGGEGLFNKVIKPITEKAIGFGGKAIDRIDKISSIGDTAIAAADKAVSAAGDTLGGIGDLFAGKSNTLVYIGIGIVAVAVLPTILNKVL